MRTQFCTLLLLASQAGPAPEPQIAVLLRNGSVLVAAAPAEPLELKTDYGHPKVPFEAIRVARRTDRGFLVVTETASFTGTPVREEFGFRTRLGRIRIAARDVESITKNSPSNGLIDDATVAHWSFSEGSGASCIDIVKGRSLKMHEMEFRAEPEGGISAVRKSPQAYASVPCDPDLELADGDVTFEVCFKAGPAIQNSSIILYKGNPLNSNPYDFGLFVQPAGTLYLYSRRTGGNFQTPQGVIRPGEWAYVAIVSRRQPPKTVCYVNGRPVMEYPQALALGGGGYPLSLGTVPALGGGNECPERFRFLRLSSIARKPEYVAEMARGMGSPAPAVLGSARSVILRDGSLLKPERLLPEGAAFRTRWGALRVSEATAGSVQIYRMREAGVAQARNEAKELVRQLGAAAVEEREQATAKLAELGEAILPVLKEAQEDPDREIRSRVAEILKKFEENGVARRPIGDVLRIGDTVLHGWLDLDEFELATRFGKFKAGLHDTERVNLGRRESRGRPVVRLKSGEEVELDPVPGSNLALESPFGRLAIPFEDVQKLSFEPAKGEWSVKTERLRASGKVSGTLEMETPAGRVALPFGEIVQLGTPGSEPSDPSDAGENVQVPRKGGR